MGPLAKLDKYRLIGQGLFPETLPPCYDGTDLKRAFRGIVPKIRARRFHKRSSQLCHFNGTKHDGSRRTFSCPNPVQYFHVCEFIFENWEILDAKISSSPLVVSKPRPSEPTADRPIIIPSLSNLTTEASEKLRFSPLIVKADISQFFPSIYTHAIPWVAHGIEQAKSDTSPQSDVNEFNALDFFVQHTQNSETRGIGVGSDAFRIIAEFIGSEIDRRLVDHVGERIIGGARHVDDFFIGVRSETDAQIVLSGLRSVLNDLHFQLNDSKTKIISGLEPLNESWAQELRKEVADFSEWDTTPDDLIRVLNKTTDLAKSIASDSPVKIYLRGVDDFQVHGNYEGWKALEPYLQRICFHHAHCIDYVFLLVAKRRAMERTLDVEGWREVAEEVIRRAIAHGHDHEIIWCLWLLILLRIELSDQLIEAVCAYNGVYSNAMIATAYAEGRIGKKPKLSYGSRLASDDKRWLEALVVRSTEYSKARFSGSFAEEFSHLAERNVKLIDFAAHLEAVRPEDVSAISHTRYGYDSDDDDEEIVAGDFEVGDFDDEPF